MKSLAYRFIIMSMVIAACLPGSARAQTTPASTESLARQADVVVVGKVSRVASAWNEDKSRIVTTVTVEVDQQVKGAGASAITLVTPGGEVDGVGELYSHTAQFKKDEEVVVFAQKDARGRFRVVAGEQGKLTVKADKTTGIRMVAGDTRLDDLVSHLKEREKAVQD